MVILIFTTVTLTLCGTRKLQLFYGEILPEFKNRSMPRTVNAICKQIIKVKKSYKISGMNFSSWEFWAWVFAPDTLCVKLSGLSGNRWGKVDFTLSKVASIRNEWKHTSIRTRKAKHAHHIGYETLSNIKSTVWYMCLWVKIYADAFIWSPYRYKVLYKFNF